MEWNNKPEKIKNDRKFPLNRRVVVLLGIFVVMMLLLGMALDAAFIFDAGTSPQQEYLRASGIPVKARVTRTDNDPQGCICNWTVSYYFETPDGASYFHTAAIDSLTYDALSEGMTIDVLYAPNDPDMSDLAGSVRTGSMAGIRLPIFTLLLPGVTLVLIVLFNRYYITRWVLLVGGLLVAYLGGVAASESWLNAMEMLRQSGVPAKATITSLTKTGEQDNRSYHVNYEFDAPGDNGQRLHFTFSNDISSSQYLLLAEGDLVPVVYLKDGSDAILKSELDVLDTTLLRSRALYLVVLAVGVAVCVVFWMQNTGHRERWLMERGRLPA